MNFLTEVTSNTATGTILLSTLASLAIAREVHPSGLMAAAGLASSYAFMLRVATAPNAIVLSSDYIRMQDMVKTGFWLQLVSILVSSLFIYFLMPLLRETSLLGLPASFR